MCPNLMNKMALKPVQEDWPGKPCLHTACTYMWLKKLFQHLQCAWVSTGTNNKQSQFLCPCCIRICKQSSFWVFKTTWCRLLWCYSYLPWKIPSIGGGFRGIMHLLCCQVLISKRFIELFQTGFSSIITDQCFLTTYNQYIWSYSIPSISCTNLMKTLQGAETLDCNFLLRDHDEGMCKCEIFTAVLLNPSHLFILSTKTFFVFLADFCASLSL